jgi:hypothetical protein
MKGITNTIKLDAHRGREFLEDAYEFRVYKVTERSSLQVRQCTPH